MVAQPATTLAQAVVQRPPVTFDTRHWACFCFVHPLHYVDGQRGGRPNRFR